MTLNEDYFNPENNINEMAVTLLPEYYNKKFINRLKEIASQIAYPDETKFSRVDVVTDKEDYRGIHFNPSDRINYAMLLFDNFHIDWLKELKILFKAEKCLLGDSDTENDYAVLANTATYKAELLKDKNGYITGLDFERYTENIHIYQGHQELYDYLAVDGVIVTATLIFEIPSRVDEEDLFWILYHELTHLHSMVKENKNTEQLNKQHTFYNFYLYGDPRTNTGSYNQNFPPDTRNKAEILSNDSGQISE